MTNKFFYLRLGLLLMGLFFGRSTFAQKPIVVSGKKFIESQVLGELVAQHLENRNIPVLRKGGLAGTFLAYRALKERSIDIYVEYSGTLAEAVYKTPNSTFSSLQERADSEGLVVLPGLGFDNSYCIVVRSDKASENLLKISDLKTRPKYRGGLSAEFRKRADGWKKLSQTYGLSHGITIVENPMGYQALETGNVDFAEAYSTDAIIDKMNFRILEDDQNFFPKYDAFVFTHKDLPPLVLAALKELSGLLNNSKMMALNQQAMNHEKLSSIAQNFLKTEGLMMGSVEAAVQRPLLDWESLGRRTQRHLALTFWAVFFAVLVAIPLGVIIYRNKGWAGPILGFVSLLQTIPSIALLSFMIPIFGIGFKPALAGLFLYSLLPILRNTYTALDSMDPKLLGVAKAIGLSPKEIFISVSLPLSLPTILAGIRTAAIINIGTATLGAFIGAGGLGEPIVEGLAMNDSRTILEGAIPAALLAIAVDFALGLVEKKFVRRI